MHSTTHRSTRREVVGSLAIAGAAAAVAGLGTVGTFTDSTTPGATTVQSGTLDIDLAQPAGVATIPVTTTNVVPGDSITRAVDLSNDGTTTLPSVTLTASATGTPSILTTDPANGLQLSLRACSVAWTQGGTAAAPSHACPGTERGLYSGPPAGDSIANADPASLNPGGLDHLVFSVSLPTSANNAFQGKSAGLSLTFTAAQRAAADR